MDGIITGELFYVIIQLYAMEKIANGTMSPKYDQYKF